MYLEITGSISGVCVTSTCTEKHFKKNISLLNIKTEFLFKQGCDLKVYNKILSFYSITDANYYLFNNYCVSCDLIAASRFNIKSFDFLKFVTNYSFFVVIDTFVCSK